MHSLKIPALALACALLATAASASIQLDQSDIPVSGPISIFELSGTSLSGGSPGFGQTVTAGLTGVLARIDLFIFASPYGSDQGGFTVSVEKTPGVALATRHLNFSDLPNLNFVSNDYSEIPQFDFTSAGIQLVVGETFNVVVTPDAGADGADAAYYYFIGAYDGGHGFARTLNGDFRYFGDLDQGFRTYIAGIPEPHLWATLIVGFGLTGVTLRRRRPATC